MRHSLVAIFGAVLLATIFTPEAQAQAPERVTPSADLQNFVRNSYIFQFDSQILPEQASERAAALVSQAEGRLGHVYSNSIVGFSANMSSVAAAMLFRGYNDIASYSRDGIASIVQASPNRGRPTNPGGGGGDGEDPVEPPQVTPWGIDRVGGADDGSTAKTGRTAWIIDTGIDLDHPDLNVDEGRSISFVTKGKGASSPNDQHGHGTHVAGTIAAIDNNIGVVGVAAGATVVAVRVLDKRGSGTWSDVIAGIDHVAAHGKAGDVVNMSLGGPENGAVNNAVIAAAANGIKFSLAAGNESTNASTRSPASANGNGIYTVSAINDADVFASFSNFGNPPVDYAAPGVSVESTSIGSGTSTKSGTSMAAPHVAGILLLGNITADGTASGDPDSTKDPIAHR